EPRVLIGETYLFELARVASYYGDGDELHLNFNIPFLWTPFEADAVRSIIDDTQAAFPRAARPVWNGGSHDISRFPSRWAGGDPRKIRCALLMLITLHGTPLLYYGEEIGMGDGAVAPERALDPLARRAPVPSAGRDPARTPMRWTASPGAGFTRPDVEAWLPLGPAETCNVDDQRADRSSTLWFCRDLIALRRSSSDLREGPQMWSDPPTGVLAFRRGERTVIAINLSDQPTQVREARGAIAICTSRDRDGERVEAGLTLGPWEGAVVYE
ncbi:MAG: DUF3459 domain-containing protein, partial [Actinobacteria bacterium]